MTLTAEPPMTLTADLVDSSSSSATFSTRLYGPSHAKYILTRRVTPMHGKVRLRMCTLCLEDEAT